MKLRIELEKEEKEGLTKKETEEEIEESYNHLINRLKGLIEDMGKTNNIGSYLRGYIYRMLTEIKKLLEK